MFLLKNWAQRARLATALLGALALGGCQPIDWSGGGGSTVTGAPLSFFLPTDGSLVGESRVLSVTGEGVEEVTFALDGAAVYMDRESPFEWTLDPAILPAGEHKVEIIALQNGQSRSVSAMVTLQEGAVSDPPPPGEDPPSDPTPPDVQFVVPPNGSTVSAPVVITVLGDTLTSVRFLVDGTQVFQDTTSPFQWTFDPATSTEGSHTLRMEAAYPGGTAAQSVTLNVVVPTTSGVPSDILTAIQSLNVGEWYMIPNTRLVDVAASPAPLGNILSIMGAWSSGAYDTKRDQFLVWGGGHADYSGNEIYAFSMKTFKWSRLTEPSAFAPGDQYNGGNLGAHPDGAPISRHSYDYIDYIPTVDRFIVGGGSGIWFTGQFEDYTTFTFDFDAKKWEKKADDPARSIGATSAVGPDGRFWQHGAWGQWAILAAYDPKTDKWTKYADYGGWLGYNRTAEIDPVNNKYVMVGSGETRVWDLNNPNAQGVKLSTQGDRGGEGTSHPGVAWDPVTKKIVVWQGGSPVYSLDVASATWSMRQSTGRNTSPPSASSNGTNGRWRYVPSLNVFVAVSYANGNVYVYKNS